MTLIITHKRARVVGAHNRAMAIRNTLDQWATGANVPDDEMERVINALAAADALMRALFDLTEVVPFAGPADTLTEL